MERSSTPTFGKPRSPQFTGHIATLQDGRQITLSELQKHKSLESAWISLGNQVFDVTQYLKRHPGGRKILLDYCGQQALDTLKRVHHWINYKVILKDLKLGHLK